MTSFSGTGASRSLTYLSAAINPCPAAMGGSGSSSMERYTTSSSSGGNWRKMGCCFRTSTDTEVVLAAYERWGALCLNRFVGMFAFAIYDVRESGRCSWHAISFGIKPLYYTLWNGQFAFASEIKALLELPGVKRRVNPRPPLRVRPVRHHGWLRLRRCSTASMNCPRRTSSDDPRLPSVSVGTPVCYWSISLSRRASLSEDDAATQLRELLRQSVRWHMRSECPLGSVHVGRPGLHRHSHEHVRESSPRPGVTRFQLHYGRPCSERGEIRQCGPTGHPRDLSQGLSSP